ncbi:MAG: tetratricopeptide repeat protein, partial [Sandaracinaceae bacterium]|nr:tetratricopeptide repeat protein [Sandaracinaceae bacterium]
LRGARRTREALGEHAALPALFDAEIALTPSPAARARLLEDKARVLEARLNEPARALAVYREALAHDPGNVRILKAIERGHRRDRAWAELAATYGELANAVEEPGLKAVWIAMRAHLVETRLGDPASAAALYELALSTDPHAAASLAHVKRLAATQGRWQTVVAALRKEHQLCGDERARRSLLETIARIEEKRLGDLDAAARTMEEALASHGDDRFLLRELARLRTAQGRPPVAPLARLVEKLDAADELASVSHRIGRLFEQELGDPERARPWYERGLGADPSHGPSALALARLYEARQDRASLLRVWTVRASAIVDAGERAELYHRMGNLLETRLGRADDAAAHHAHAHALDATHHESFLALCRLHAAAGRWYDLAELYERAIDRAAHDAEAIAWLFRLGAVYEDHLGELGGALAAYERILERDPDHLGALHAVARAAERAGHHERVVEALAAEARLAGEARRAQLLHRAAVLRATQLGDRSGAKRTLEDVLAFAPAHAPTLRTLAELASNEGQWDRHVELSTRLLPLQRDPKENSRLQYRIGEVHETQRGDAAAAIAAYRRALELDPDLELARAALAALLERTGAFEDLAAALEEQRSRLKDPAARARAATELGELYESRLGDRERALASYERALEDAPGHRAALDARERLLTGSGDVQRLALALHQEAASARDEFSKTQTSLRAGLVIAEQAGGAAMRALRPILVAQPSHVGALLAVEQVYRDADDVAGLASTYERIADSVRDAKAVGGALSELTVSRAALAQDTAEVQRRILGLDAGDARALEHLAVAAAREGDFAAEVAMLTELTRVARDPALAAAYRCRAGEILLLAGDARGALSAYRAALAGDPQSLSAAFGLTRAACESDDPRAMREAARYETFVTRDVRTAQTLLLDAAERHYRADEEHEAAAAYQEALSLNPDSPEAAMGLMATMTRGESVSALAELLSRAAHASRDASRSAVLYLCVAQLHADVREDLAAAVAAAERAVAARPSYEHATSSLAGYLERSGRWSEAADVLERLIALTQGAVSAHLRLASLAERGLRDPERAIRNLQIVLAKDESQADALTSLVRLERLRGNVEEALRLARKLISVVPDDEHRAAALAEMAELESGRGQPEAAATAAYWAIGVQGPRSSASRLYRSLIARAPEHASWEHYVTALLTYLERAKGRARERDLAVAYRELARVFSEGNHRPDHAVTVLREGVSSCPDDASISLALVNALRYLGADAEALGELRRLLGVDVGEVGAWRVLADVLARMGVPDGSTAALAPVVALGQATADEERAVRARRPRAGMAPAGILAEGGLKRLIETNVLDQSPALFIPAIGEILAKIEGIDLERRGVNKRERLRAGDPHALRAFVDRIGRIFGGVPEYELFLNVRSVEWPVIVSGAPHALLCPPSIESMSEPARAFLLARPLVLLARGLQVLDHVDTPVLERILVATVRQFDVRFSLHPLMDQDELEKETRRVAKAIGFFSKSRVQEAVSAFMAAPPRELGAWAAGIRKLAMRAALLVADDLLASLEALGEPLGPDNHASELARFWVSDPAIAFRRAMLQQPPQPPPQP